MPVRFAVDVEAAIPVYEQLRSSIAGAIVGGRLVPGDRLPTARALADELGIAVNTVIRAYGELSDARLISSRRRFGTVVSADAAHVAPADVVAAAARLALRASAAELTREQAVDLLRFAMSSEQGRAAERAANARPAGPRPASEPPPAAT